MSIRKRKWNRRGIERTAWVVDYFDQAGKRRLKTFKTKKDADRWAVSARHEIQQGIHTPASASPTVEEAGARWIANCEAEGLEFGTVKQRREHLRLHIIPFVGREKLSGLTMPRVYQFDAELRANGRSVSMRRKVLTNLKTLLTYAQSQGLVAQNVARGVKIKADDRNTPGPLREGHDYPTKSELRLLIDKTPPKWRAFIVTAIFTGMRIGELRGLRWQDIDLDAGIIHVRQRADAWCRMGKPKSKAGNRDIPLAPMVLNTLRQWKLVCRKGDADLAFPNGTGNPENYSNIFTRCWAPLQTECFGQVKYPFHAIRHAAASLFIAHLGWTPKRVQTVMGHSSITMTYDHYGHLFEDRNSDQEAMKRLEAALTATTPRQAS